MLGTPRLIWCADGNFDHSRAAISAGWLYGVRLPARGILPGAALAFADQDWKTPNRCRYMGCLAQHRPTLATVLDWEREDQLPEVLSWAEEAAQYVSEAVLIIPKVPGAVSLLPRRIGSKSVWLAYSVPTSYGGSPLGLWEFRGWPVHLLGGSPQKQIDVWRYLRGICEVMSADGNMAKKMATGRCCYWSWRKTNKGHWTTLKGFDGNAPLECVRRSTVAIKKAWEGMSRTVPPPPCPNEPPATGLPLP